MKETTNMSLWTKKEQKTKNRTNKEEGREREQERKRSEQFLRAWYSCGQSGLWKQQIIKENLDLRTKFWFSFAMTSCRIFCQRSWKLKPIYLSYFCSQLKQVATVQSTLCRKQWCFSWQYQKSIKVFEETKYTKIDITMFASSCSTRDWNKSNSSTLHSKTESGYVPSLFSLNCVHFLMRRKLNLLANQTMH